MRNFGELEHISREASLPSASYQHLKETNESYLGNLGLARAGVIF